MNNNESEHEWFLRFASEKGLSEPDFDCSLPVPTGATQCEGNTMHLYLMGYGFIVIFCLAMIGNCLNLLIYNSDHIRYYLAIRMLCTRLLMNTLTMLCLLPNALRLLRVWQPQSAFDEAYWKLWPYTLFFGNLFGFCAMWMTVLMIGECYLHIFLPARSKAVCTHMNLRKCYVIIMTAGAALAIIYPVNRSTFFGKDKCGRETIHIRSNFNSSLIMEVWEKAHTAGNLVFALLLPLCLLVFMTLSIFWKLRIDAGDETKSHFSNEKRSVTRLTLITTALQLADIPSVFVFLYALRGPTAISSQCNLNAVSLFLSLVNMSMSFYVYLLFSPRFRKMVTVRFADLGHALVLFCRRRGRGGQVGGRRPRVPLLTKETASSGGRTSVGCGTLQTSVASPLSREVTAVMEDEPQVAACNDCFL